MASPHQTPLALTSSEPGSVVQKTLAEAALAEAMQRAYLEGRRLHGDLGLSREALLARFHLVIEKLLSRESPDGERLACFLRLHTGDLYLTTACAAGSHAAWERFDLLHRKPIRDFSRRLCGSADEGYTLATDVVEHLYVPDRSGSRRIGSYSGRSSLTSWLAVVARNVAARQRLAQGSALETLDSSREIVDGRNNPELDFEAREHWALLCEALHYAAKSLSDHERFVLTLRHRRDLRPSQIARLCCVQRSSITRQLERTYKKLHRLIEAFLCDKNCLSTNGGRGLHKGDARQPVSLCFDVLRS